MNSSPWSAYSQHYSRLVGTGNPAAGSLTQGTSLNELTLSASLPRQEHMGGYGSAANAHHLLLSSHPGINPTQATNRTEGSFNAAGLFSANYDPSVFCAPFQTSAKNHLSSFSQGSNFYKAVNRESDFSDLRGGFMHCNVTSNPINPDGGTAIPGGSGLSSSVLFNSPMASSTWRHSAVMPSSCGPFGILPHEAIMSRNHLVERGSDKIVSQSAKASRTSLTAASFLEQDLNSGYRTVLPSPSRPPSSFLDASGGSHPMLTPQSDPYLTSDSYFSSASKSNFPAYTTFGANLHNSVSRNSSVASYFYPQSYTSFGASVDKTESSVPQNTSTTTNGNFVPNTGVIVNSMQMQNGQSLRQSVISKGNNNSSSNSHVIQAQHNSPYGQNLYYFSSISPDESHIPRSVSNTTPQSITVQGFGNISSSHQLGQMSYPPMSTPAPASTPANPPPSVSIGQAYIPGSLGHNHESSSVGAYGDIYSSPPTSAATYSASGTHPSTPASPRKSENMQHTPQACSVDHSSLDVDSNQFVDSVQLNNHEDDKCIEEIVRTSLQPGIRSCENHHSAKLLEDDLSIIDSGLMTTETSVQEQKSLSMSHPMLSMHSINNERTKAMEMESVYDGQTMPMNLSMLDAIASSQTNNNYMQQQPSQCAPMPVPDVYDLPESLTPPPAEPRKKKGKRGRKKNPVNKLFTFGITKYKPYTETLVSIVKSKEVKLTKNRNKKKGQNESRIQVMNNFTNNNVLPLVTTESTTSESTDINNSNVTNEEQIVNFINFSNPVVTSTNWNFSNQSNINNEKLSNLDENENKTDNSNCQKNDTVCLQNAKDKEGIMDDELGFLTEELQPHEDGDKNDSSKSDDKPKPGFLQSFLSFLEDTENDKKVPKKPNKLKFKQQSCKSSSVLTTFSDLDKIEQEERKEWLLNGDVSTKKKENIDDDDGEEHFGETTSLDTSLFGSTLQKEVIVPNPEAPSFSSDEEDNSCQGLADTVAMAIQRLCDDNEQMGPSYSQQPAEKIKDDQDKKIKSNKNSSPAYQIEKDDSTNLKTETQKSEENKNISETLKHTNKVIAKQPNLKDGTSAYYDLKKKVAEHLEEEEEINQILSDTESQGIKKKYTRKCKNQLLQRNHSNPNKKRRMFEKEMNENNIKFCTNEEIDEVTASFSASLDVNSKEKEHSLQETDKVASTEECPALQQTVINSISSKDVDYKIIRKHHEKKGKHKKQKLLKGHFRIGDYITLYCDLKKNTPPIWRIESKFILQRFQLFEQDGKCLYSNTSSYSAWRPSSKSKYTPLPVSVLENKNGTVIIEKLPTSDVNNSKEIYVDNSASHPLRENFEVFLQTLVSQVLDPSFINEIIKENDKYFLSHLQEIEDVMQERKEFLLRWGSWNSQLRHCAETYPNIHIVSYKEKGKLRCQICHGKLSRHSVQFSGQLYNQDTMEPCHNSVNCSLSSSEFPVCSNCVTIITLFSYVHHHKFHFFHKCCSRVDLARAADDKKESHAILEECLQDTDWITQMFHEMENLWDACDSLR